MKINNMLLMLLIILFILLLLKLKLKKNLNDNCLIPFDLYPKLNQIIKNKHIIIQELNNVLYSNRWILYDDLHHKLIFKKNNIDDVFKILKSKETSLSINLSEKPTWKLYGLLFNRQIYNNDCPNTIKLLLNIPNVINAGFSCLEAGKSTDYHTDNNDEFYRVQIPLIIPHGNCKFKINDQIIDWSMPFIFDDNCLHQAWNLTNENRYVLILDILK